MTEKVPKQSKYAKPLFFAVGCTLVPVGVAGVFLPLLPGTIFLIIAAACFARSSARFEKWLIDHPKFGPEIVAWRETGAIARKVKIVAIGSMAISYALIVWSSAPPIALLVSGTALLASALFVGTRPAPPNQS